MTAPVAIDPRARREWPALHGLAYAVPGTVLIGEAGEVLRVRPDGGVDQVLPGGHPRAGAASEPCNARRAA